MQSSFYDAVSPQIQGLGAPDKLRLNEYLVVAHTRVQELVEKDENGYVKDIWSVMTEDIQTRVMVKNYGDAAYLLLAEAQRIRNYSAYFTKSQHPLDFRMTGERNAVVNKHLPLVGAIFDGATHLPFTDGGFGKTSVFTTRYGPDEGLKPPYEYLTSEESVKAWITDLNNRLKLTARMLTKVPRKSACEAAINCVGESFWTGEGKDRFLACWRAIDSIAKSDHPKEKRTEFKHIRDTLRKRLETQPGDDALNSLRELRHLAAHSWPNQDDYPSYHTRLREIYGLARELTDSLITETTGVNEELRWDLDDWRIKESKSEA